MIVTMPPVVVEGSTISRIPRHVVSAAIQHAQTSPFQEVGGMFGLMPEGDVRYLPGVNTAPDPDRAVELDAAWIASCLQDRGVNPIAFFHSHPGGSDSPSAEDVTNFPWYYVQVCFIYYGVLDRLVAYDTAGYSIAKVADDGLFVSGMET